MHQNKLLASAIVVGVTVLSAFAAEKYDANTNAYWEATAVVPAPKAPADCAFVDETLAKCAENYSVLLANAIRDYTPAKPYPKRFRNGKVEYIPDWDWCTGFWPGSLWLLYEATGDLKWKFAAEKYSDELIHIRFSNLHHDLGFMALPPAGNGLRITGDKKYAMWLYDSARALQTRWRPGAKAIQAWGVWGGKWGDSCSIIVDAMLNMELFEFAANYPASGKLTAERDWLEGGSFRDMAEMHVDTSIKYLLRPDGSSHHMALIDFKTGELIENRTGQGIGHWSRGQSWVVYGFPMMYEYTKNPKYLEIAKKVADYAMTQKDLPADSIPYWDYEAPNIPNEERDSSAAAVIGCGLLRLSRLVDDKALAAKYRAEAIKIAKSLSSDAYFCKPTECGGFLLKHAVGSKPDKAEIDMPLNYGEYYFLELLLDLKRTRVW